jgi:predicted negative regulator of RcsB-dependent stress response
VEIYETEEEQVAALKAWWKENSHATFIGVGLGVAIILGWNYWQSYKKEQAMQSSAIYSKLLSANEVGNKAQLTDASEQIRKAYGSTDYNQYAALFEANNAVQQGDQAKARVLLDSVASSSDLALSNIAKIRRVRLMLANKEYEQGLAYINAIDPATTAGFSGHYDELVGDLYVALDRLDLARTSYESALRNGLQSPLLAMKIDDLTVSTKKMESKQ